MAAFEMLNALNLNGHTEQKNVGGTKLTYLSWPWAWAEVKKNFPDAHYTIWKNAEGLPYTVDPNTGYMVYTSVTIEGITHEMWLPVMNGANRAMKPEAYEYTSGNYKKTVEAATMMDINKTIMRCLVKNLAMFGLGLYIYAGEDLPEVEQDEQRSASMVQEANVRPQASQNAAQAASATVVDKLPATAPQAVKQAENRPETAASYLMRKITELTAAYRDYGFNFAETRKSLIQAGLVEDVPSATMSMEQAKELIRQVDKFYADRKARAAI